MRMRSKLALGSRALPTRQVILPLAKQALCCCAFCHRSWHRTPTANIHLVRNLHPPPRPPSHQRCDATMRCDACPIDLDPSPMICVRGGAGNAHRRRQRQFSQLLQRAYSRPAGLHAASAVLPCAVRLVGAWLACAASATTIMLPSFRVSISRPAVSMVGQHGTAIHRRVPPRQLDKRITTRDARGCATLLGCGASQIALDAFPTPSRCLGSSQRRLLATPPSSLHTAHHMLSSGPRRQPVATWMPCIAFAPHAHVRARRCAASVGGSIEC